MKTKKRIVLLILLFLLFITSATSYSKFLKILSMNGSISTTDYYYCDVYNITSLSECLIRSDSQQPLANALNIIDNRSANVDFGIVEPINAYMPSTNYYNYTDKTDTSEFAETTSSRFTYVVESKLITDFDITDTDITKISFNRTSGEYSFSDSVQGNINDIVTTETDISNGIYKYTCLNRSSTGECTSLYLFTEAPYLISGAYRFKQGYKYSYDVVGTSSSNAGLYKAEDDYTIYLGDTPIDNFSYYYRGSSQNNWVSFGGFLWRVIRINGDGSIRMIYSGLENESSHTGSKASAFYTTYGDTTEYTTTTPDISGLTSDLITTTYNNGRFGNTYVGYMYNPLKEIATYPNKQVGVDNDLDHFLTYDEISELKEYYFFKNFDPSTDCFLGSGNDEEGACTLKCRSLGNDGDTGIDCVKSNYYTLASTPGNYDTTAPGSTDEFYVFTSDYKYSCWSNGEAVKHSNSDGTTSVYITCPIVSEIVGIVDDTPYETLIKAHGLFSPDETTAHMNVKDNQIKIAVENWYSNNILNKSDGNGHLLEDYLSDEIFCNDRSSNSSAFPFTKYGDSYTYGAYIRNRSNKNPSFKCPNISNDGFTLKTSGTTSTVTAKGVGNHLLNYPIGLITADEFAYAGGVKDLMNQNYYLFTGKHYWSMTPYRFYTYNLNGLVWDISTRGVLDSVDLSDDNGTRPVINLKPSVKYVGGKGLESNPYIISID